MWKGVGDGLFKFIFTNESNIFKKIKSSNEILEILKEMLNFKGILKIMNMKGLIQRIAMMSVALVLFCYTATAKNVNDDKGMTDNSSGVMVDGNVTVKRGKTKTLKMTVLEGFDNPLLIYVGERFDINSRIEGKTFSARIIKEEENYFLQIKARETALKGTETIYVRAQKIIKQRPKLSQKEMQERRNKNKTAGKKQQYGLPVTIKVIP